MHSAEAAAADAKRRAQVGLDTGCWSKVLDAEHTMSNSDAGNGVRPLAGMPYHYGTKFANRRPQDRVSEKALHGHQEGSTSPTMPL